MSEQHTQSFIPADFQYNGATDDISRSPSRVLRMWLPLSIGVLVVVVAVLLAGLEAIHASNVASKARRDIGRVSAANRGLAAQVKTLSGDSSGSGVAALNSEVSTLQTTVSSLTQKTGSLSSRLNKICNSQAVASEQSNLNGEQTGSGASYDSQYYSDLYNILNAVCTSY